MKEFQRSDLFNKNPSPAAVITGSTNGTEHFNFAHEACGEEMLLKFLNLEKSWYRRNGEEVPFWVGRFETRCPKCNESFVIKQSFSASF